MANIGEKIPRKKKITGYKVAMKDGNKYRSIYTNQIYTPGKKMVKYNKNKTSVEGVPYPLQNFVWFCFDEKYNGFTSVYKDEKNASLANSSIGQWWASTLPQTLVVIKVTISGELRESKLADREVYLGKQIDEIQEIRMLLAGKE